MNLLICSVRMQNIQEKNNTNIFKRKSKTVENIKDPKIIELEARLEAEQRLVKQLMGLLNDRTEIVTNVCNALEKKNAEIMRLRQRERDLLDVIYEDQINTMRSEDYE